MDSRFQLLAAALLVLCLSPAAAQTLSVSDQAPSVDGVVAAGEYSLSRSVGKITLWATRTADELYLAVSAPTAGWVAVGFGSPRMDGADLFLGYVSGGKASFTQQLGRGHSHGPLGKPLEVRDALRETAGTTTMETAFPAAQVLDGGKELWVLVAYGPNDSFASYHVARGSVQLKL